MKLTLKTHQAIAGFSLICLFGTSSCVTTQGGQQLGNLLGGLAAGAVAYGGAKAFGANNRSAALWAAGAAAATFVTLHVIQQRQATMDEQRRALAAANRSSSKSNTVYVPVSRLNGRIGLIKVNKATKKVSPVVKEVNGSVKAGQKVSIEGDNGDVVYG